MKIKVTSSTMVKPMVAKASTTLWLSNIDLLMPSNFHTPIAIFYRSTGSVDFFKSSVLKAALSRALVEFYPMAGRLVKNGDRTEVNCNGEGALLLEAESDGRLDDFSNILQLSPAVDYSGGISTFPLLLIQVTRFKCGGVCLGFAIDHELADGFSSFHFIKAWSEIARGVDITVVPSVDRRVLSARRPPLPQYHHVEYQTPPAMKSITPPDNLGKTITSTFKITRDQLNALKDKVYQSNTLPYSTYTVLAGHVWRCVTKARALPEDQETMLFIPIDGRSRMQPPLPRGYFGNAAFAVSCSALCGELDSNLLEFAARKIYDAIARMDDQYMRSAIDSLELQMPAGNFCMCPNLVVNSWAKFGVEETDFGWGKPVSMGYCGYIPEGVTLVLPSLTNDGGLLCVTSLPEEQMQVFEHLLYHI